MTSGTSSSAPEADFASTPVASGLWRAVVTIAFTANAAAERRIAPTLCGSVIWSSTSTMPSCARVIDIGRGQGIGLRQKPLVHGVGAEPLVDQVRPDDFRGNAGVDILVRQALGGVFGQEQFSDLPVRVGQRGRNRVPAIENHRPVRARFPLPADRPGGRISALFRRVYRRHGGTAVFGRDRSWGACVTGPRIWQFGCLESRF